MSERSHTEEDSSRGRGGSNMRGRGRGRGGSSMQQQKRFGGPSDKAPDTIPSGSVSKLKSQLRQTKRLLARDDLTPDVRTTSERRLELLEQELEKAQHSQLERKMVLRYKGIRFFERQKLLRKIKQAKRALSEKPDDAALKQSLRYLRVDLAYVIRYPKTEKYIAIFPEGEYVPHEAPPTSSSSSSSSDDSAAKSALRRWSLRKEFGNKMKNEEVGDAVEDGDLGIEGEVDHEKGESEDEGETGSGRNEKGKRKRQDENSAPARPAKKDKKEQKSDKTQTSKKTQDVQPQEPEADAEPEETRALTRKEKKDLKDARRRAKKQAEAAAGDSGDKAELEQAEPKPEPLTAKKVEQKSEKTSDKRPEKKAATNKLADEDDFFA